MVFMTARLAVSVLRPYKVSDIQSCSLKWVIQCLDLVNDLSRK
uniref:Uncharacterized protein n=1 Tax=Anguilla anguilla TaxID=7936 RepID=A0A0E9W2M0_ANGAN